MDIDRDEANDWCNSLFSGFLRLQCLFGAENNLYVNVEMTASPALRKK